LVPQLGCTRHDPSHARAVGGYTRSVTFGAVLARTSSLFPPLLLVLALSVGPAAPAAAADPAASSGPPDAPAAAPAPSDDAPAPARDADARPDARAPAAADVSAAPPDVASPAAAARSDWGPFGFLGDLVPPGESRRL